jgi:hypothetical protein
MTGTAAAITFLTVSAGLLLGLAVHVVRGWREMERLR